MNNSLIGKQFGKLTVNSFYRMDKNRHSIWNCSCICGNKTLAIRCDLISNSKTSCGCNRKLANNEGPKRALYRSYKTRAKIKKRTFELNKEEFFNLIDKSCHYCGTLPRLSRIKGYAISFNGIDRINNTLGYTLDNAVSCCKTCNYMKLDLSAQQFKDHINKIYRKNNA